MPFMRLLFCFCFVSLLMRFYFWLFFSLCIYVRCLNKYFQRCYSVLICLYIWFLIDQWMWVWCVYMCYCRKVIPLKILIGRCNPWADMVGVYRYSDGWLFLYFAIPKTIAYLSLILTRSIGLSFSLLFCASIFALFGFIISNYSVVIVEYLIKNFTQCLFIVFFVCVFVQLMFCWWLSTVLQSGEPVCHSSIFQCKICRYALYFLELTYKTDAIKSSQSSDEKCLFRVHKFIFRWIGVFVCVCGWLHWITLNVGFISFVFKLTECCNEHYVIWYIW